MLFAAAVCLLVSLSNFKNGKCAANGSGAGCSAGDGAGRRKRPSAKTLDATRSAMATLSAVNEGRARRILQRQCVDTHTHTREGGTENQQPNEVGSHIAIGFTEYRCKCHEAWQHNQNRKNNASNLRILKCCLFCLFFPRTQTKTLSNLFSTPVRPSVRCPPR